MKRRVFVSGYGALTGFGLGVEPLRLGLFAGRDAIVPVERFATEKYRAKRAAQSPFLGDEFDACLSCARDAIRSAKIEDPRAAALLLGTSGDVGRLQRFWRAQGQGLPPQECDALLSMPGTMVETLAQELGTSGLHFAFTSACVASSTALAHAHSLIEKGQIELALCGGSSLLSEEFFALFDSGRALSKSGYVRPFSRERDGLLLGDGVAFLVLESERSLHARGVQPRAELVGWGISDDGFHVCQPHPEGDGMVRAIRQALGRANVSPADVGYVNAHGTGTPLNDRSESRALRRIFGEDAPRVPVSSTKGALGHTLEASGAIEALICVLALEQGRLPPTVGFLVPDPECAQLHVLTVPTAAPGLSHALSTNSAFGGVNTALLLRAACLAEPECSA